MLMVVGRSTRCAGAESVSLPQFFGQELAMFRRGVLPQGTHGGVGAGVGVEPDIAFESNLIPLLKAVVRQGFAVTTFLRMALEEEPALTGIPFHPLSSWISA